MRKFIQKILVFIFPQLNILKSKDYDFTQLRSWKNDSVYGEHVQVYPVSLVSHSSIGDYTYINGNSVVFNTSVGKFCSIGPNFFCGWGEHPINGISTHPAFYSTRYTPSFVNSDKVEENKKISIGNDVFIGANVTVLDGVTIGDGAIIGAGAIVSKNIPPYAIAVGSPIRIIKYRFSAKQIESLLRIKWWNFDESKFHDVDKMFFDIDSFIRKYDKVE